MWDETPAGPGKRKQYICSICKGMFNKLEQLMNHTKAHPENQYGCDECGWHFNLIAGLSLHGHDCHDPRHHVCQWCPKYFDSAEELHKHNQSKHYFECSSCFDFFPTADELREHKERKHGGLQPDELEQQLLRQGQVTQMQEERRKEKAKATATQGKYFGCEHCLQSFGSQKDLDDHTLKEHIFICGVCFKIFYAEAERDTHMDKEHEVQQKKLTEQEKLLVKEWQKRMSREEKDRRVKQDWEETWSAYVASKQQ